MGQYFQAVNLTKKEYVDPDDYDIGLKLMESVYESKWTDIVLTLLSGHWHGDDVAYCGDYAWAEESSADWSKWLHEHTDSNPFDSPEFKRIQPEWSLHRFVVNETKNVYYNRLTCPYASWDNKEMFGQFDPLLVFLAAGNELGGGDYYGANKELAGSWLGDTIYGTNTPPENMTLIDSPFKE